VPPEGASEGLEVGTLFCSLAVEFTTEMGLCGKVLVAGGLEW